MSTSKSMSLFSVVLYVKTVTNKLDSDKKNDYARVAASSKRSHQELRKRKTSLEFLFIFLSSMTARKPSLLDLCP